MAVKTSELEQTLEPFSVW